MSPVSRMNDNHIFVSWTFWHFSAIFDYKTAFFCACQTELIKNENMITIIVFLWHWCSSFLALKKVNFMWLTSFLLETGFYVVFNLYHFTCSFRAQSTLQTTKSLLFVTLSDPFEQFVLFFLKFVFLPGNVGWWSIWGLMLIWGFRRRYPRPGCWQVWSLCNGEIWGQSRRFGWHGSAFDPAREAVKKETKNN